MLAGGGGTRVGADRNKVYLPLDGRTVLSWSLTTFAAMPEIGHIVLVVRAADRALAQGVLDREVDHAAIEIVVGGDTRQASELAGLRLLADRIRTGAVDCVLIHDGARPLVSTALTVAVLAAARADGGAVPGLVRDDLVAATADGTAVGAPAPGLVAAQTPQAFRAGPLLAAYEQAERHGFIGTDTASCVQRFAPELAVRFVPGEEHNIKITFAHDLAFAAHARRIVREG